MPAPRKEASYGPNFYEVEQWLRFYKEGTGRHVTITLGSHQHRNGQHALFVSCVSYRLRERQEHVHSHETCWYWPSSRFVSLAALCMGLIHAHEKETDALADKWARVDQLPRPEGTLPF